MKIAPVKFNNNQYSTNSKMKKQTPVKDALIVSAYCTTPFAFYEITSRIVKSFKSMNSETFER